MKYENVIVVVGKTRLQQLIQRFNTKAQAQFYIEHAGGDFTEYELEHETFQHSLNHVLRTTSTLSKMKLIDKEFLPNFLFSKSDIVVALGQDGLVANTAKYIGDQPLIGVNPDPNKNDGVLLPFLMGNFESGLRSVLENQFSCKKVTMAHAMTNDGQELLAFNDLFIGPASHTSARYKLSFDTKSEEQSSSGIIVSTGAGSTGWLSSTLNMANGINSSFYRQQPNVKVQMEWEEDRLAFVVREPFLSKHSQISLTAGYICGNYSLEVESHMPFNGVIFSDGIESDFLKFNAGCCVEIKVAKQRAHLVQIR